MAATYDPTLPRDKDWVRLQIGDRGTFSAAPAITGAVLSDEEINAILAEEANKYLAAARLGDVILAKGRGVVSKSVSSLSLSWGDSPEGSYRAHLQRLRERGCQLLLKGSGGSVFRVL